MVGHIDFIAEHTQIFLKKFKAKVYVHTLITQNTENNGYPATHNSDKWPVENVRSNGATELSAE